MNRVIVEGLATPVPIGSLLPEPYRRYDANIGRFSEALDEVLAPVWLVLDCYDAYLDPMLAPLDFVELLASWVGFPLDRNWTPGQTRRLVATAVELYRWRGTTRGIVELVKAYTGVVPTVEESGGTAWSQTPGSPAPGDPEPAVRVLVELPEQTPADLERLSRLIAANVPAHVDVVVEVRRSADIAPLPEPVEPIPRPFPVVSIPRPEPIVQIPRDPSRPASHDAMLPTFDPYGPTTGPTTEPTP